MVDTSARPRRVSAATRITAEKWFAARSALEEVTNRFARLVLDADPDAMATADWTVMDTAAHVTGLAWYDAALTESGDARAPIEGMQELIPTTNVEGIHEVNALIRRNYAERDPHKVVDKLLACTDEILAKTADADPGLGVSWIGGSTVPLAGLLAHQTNELLIHGRDIARAPGVRVPWHLPHEDGARFFELFLVEIVRYGYGQVLDDDNPVRKGRVAVQFRSAYTDPVTIVLEDGVVSIEEPSADNDVRLNFKPTALSLMLFHRYTPLQTALRGGVRISGARPWLLPHFLRKVRLP